MTTSYTILEKKNGSWTEAGYEDASSATAAIRVFVGGTQLADGEFVAIPSRSFKPVKIKIERTVKVG